MKLIDNICIMCKTVGCTSEADEQISVLKTKQLILLASIAVSMHKHGVNKLHMNCLKLCFGAI